MMEEKDLERLYRERFKHFEAHPETDLWSAITVKLDHTPSKRPGKVIWFRAAGIAAASLALLWMMRPAEDALTTPKDIEVELASPGSFQQNFNSSNIEGIESRLSADPSAGSLANEDMRLESNNTSSRTFLTPVHLTAKTFEIALQEHLPQAEYALQPSKKINDLATYVPANTASSIPINTNTQTRRWAISPSVAPVYYSSLYEGSPVDENFNNNPKQGETHISYGLQVAYRLNKRLSLRTGLNNITLGYTTAEVYFSPGGSSPVLMRNIDHNNSGVNIYMSPTGARPSTSIAPEGSKSNTVYQGDLVQRMSYLEVPLEFSYNLVNRDIGLRFIGGMSSLFLTDNSIQLQANTLNTEVGEANNLSAYNFSTNIGLGLDYRFTKQLFLNIEPVFKYQWNTFSRDSGGFSPYILGIYSGISFRF